jgi:hypothetical protein
MNTVIESKFVKGVFINYCYNGANLQDKNGNCFAPNEIIEPEIEHSYLRRLIMAEMVDLYRPIQKDKYDMLRQNIRVYFLDGNIIDTAINGSRVDIWKHYRNFKGIDYISFNN